MYSSTENTTQTIGSSGCGPTSAAMVVSSIKGTITPDTMASLFVQNGYRSANNGTYWSAYRAVADEFNIEYTETSDIQKAIQLLQNNNYVICSCGNGLFTTGGHYIVIVGIAYKDNPKYLVDNRLNQYWIHNSVVFDDNRVYGLGIVVYDGGQSDLVQIFDTQFWCSEDNMSIPTVVTNINNEAITNSNRYTTGNYKTTYNLNVRIGPGTNYKN